MSDKIESCQLAVSCYCGSATHTFHVPLASLPLPTHLCSCNISRRISGSLLTSYVNITHGLDPPNPNVSQCTPYRSSDILTRHFCSTCGTHMYLEYHHDGHFEAATGTLQVESTEGIVDYKAHIWIEDTPDGGASQFITHIGDRELKRYLQEPGRSEEVPLQWRRKIPDSNPNKQARIHAHCHCKGVEFYISPPNAESERAESAWPDLLVPSPSGASKNSENYPWWILSPGRFLAGTCACISCRRASGHDITFWTFVPACNITLDAAGTQPFTRTPYWGTMKTYQSSDGIIRTFCNTCGANIFFDADWRPSLVDVAVGLLEAESGARAEEILAWWPGRVSFTEYALNRKLVQGLEEGLKSWAERNRGAEHVATGMFPR